VVEQRFRKPSVAGSIPAIGSIFSLGKFFSNLGRNKKAAFKWITL
jgi:hypothetical protein